MTNIRPNDSCPCGSSKRFKNCCQKKDLQWRREDDGSFTRIVPMAPELAEHLIETKNNFEAIMGRKPHKHDPILLGQFLHSMYDMERETIHLLKQSGADPAHIYAYQKTDGLLMTEHNLNLLPDNDIAEWQAAIDEYYDL